MGDSIRNIERIEENDDAPRIPRAVTVALVVLGGACAVLVALALGGRTSGAPEKKGDPLGDLLAARSRTAQPGPTASIPGPTELSPREVTFPSMLSDSEHPSTALAAVRSGPAPSWAPTASRVAGDQPPPPTDRLSVVPIPALSAPAPVEPPAVIPAPAPDPLAKAASDAIKLDTPSPWASPRASSTEAAPAGHEGGYQLQVSSFRTAAEAATLSEQLRARGHKAYVIQANVPGRGTWYRVRIGPFASQRAASEYRTTFEDREHVVPFLVTPEPPKAPAR
jgi:DedD protein